MNNLNKNNTTPDVEDPMGSEDAKPSTGIYVLEEGETLNKEFANAETITFTWEKAADGVQTKDVSQNKDGSVVLWKDGNNYYVSTQRAGQVIYMNAISSKMFKNCRNLTEIHFKNIDTFFYKMYIDISLYLSAKRKQCRCFTEIAGYSDVQTVLFS